MKVFGHKVPDTDAVCSALVRAWDLNQQGFPAQAFRLGELNKETAFVLQSLGCESPPLLTDPLLPGQSRVAIVDTNNPAELPDGVESARVHSIIDHHKLAAMSTAEPIEVDIRPLCSAGSILYERMKAAGVVLPPQVAGLLLSCILSDSLEFRSPTTTAVDRVYARELADISGLDMHAHAEAMFRAKADIADLTAAEVVVSDSKLYTVGGRRLRVSVHETTDAAGALARLQELQLAMREAVAGTPDLDQFLFFVVDILNEEATFVGVDTGADRLVEAAFGVTLGPDGTAVLPGVLSRKKQIMPALETAARQ